MTKAEKHIRHYNRLNGKPINKAKLGKFFNELRADIKAGRIDAHVPYGLECIEIEKRIGKALSSMNGSYDFVVKLATKPIKIVDYSKLQKKAEPVKEKKETRVAEVTKPERDSKRPLVERKESSKAAPVPSKKSTGMAGFTTADKAPEKPVGTFKLKGPIGEFLGEQQRYRMQVIIDGEKHSSKSELAKQVADAFIDAGFKTSLVDYEQGGLMSKDTQAGINRNVKPANRKALYVSNADFPASIDALKSIADKFDVIIVDSGSKIGEVTNEWLDQLRVDYPDTIWVVLMHQNSKGTTKGGTAAGYNAPVVIKTYRPDSTNPMKNYAWVEKNRGNRTDVWYLIAQKKVVYKDPKVKKVEQKPSVNDKS
jgi:hypothetical protein